MTDHRWLESAAPYALGTLDREEHAAFEAHLAGCAACRAEVQAVREVAGLLAYSAPDAAPPAALRERVLAEGRRVRPLPRPRPARAPWLAAAAAAVLALAAGYAWWQARSEMADVRAALAARDFLLEAILAPDVSTAALAATGQPPSARVFYNPGRHRVVMAVYHLPPAPAGRTYQLWAIATGKPPVSLGTFNTPPEGRLTMALDVPRDLTFTLTAVTEEPAGGSPQPTQNPFLIGELKRSD